MYTEEKMSAVKQKVTKAQRKCRKKNEAAIVEDKQRGEGYVQEQPAFNRKTGRMATGHQQGGRRM